MIDSKQIIDLLKLKNKSVIVYDLDKNMFIEPASGKQGNFKFLKPVDLDDIILKKVFGDNVGQNELLLMHLLKDMLSKKLQPGQVQNVKKKMEQGGLPKRKKRKAS